MKRTTTFALLLVLSACNDHPIKIVEYQHWYGDSLGEPSGSSDSSGGSEDGSETGTSGDESGDDTSGGESGDDTSGGDSGDDTSGDEGGGYCGDGYLDPGEDCDDGEDNGPPPAWCSDDCVFQGPQ